jgi:hypothetical protein
MNHYVRVTHVVHGQADLWNVRSSCPFWTTTGCSIKKIDCRYGLTEISVPPSCPLRSGQIFTTVTLEKGSKVRMDRNEATLGCDDGKAQRCIAATPSGVVLDPFMGSGTSAIAAEILGREWIGAEISQKYCESAQAMIRSQAH